MSHGATSWVLPAFGRPSGPAQGSTASAGCLPRRDLVERLLRLPGGGLGLVVAPAGYGGTTLLRLLVEASPLPAIGVVLPAANTGPSFTERLAAELNRAKATLSTASLVVVDDLEPAAHRPLDPTLVRFLDQIPPSARVVLRTRRSAGLDVSALLATGRLVVVSTADLTLEAADATAHLHVLAPSLPASRAAALVDLAEGWIGALTAAVVGSGWPWHDDPAGWLLGPGLDLLVEPIARRLSPEDRELMVRCSVLPVLAGDVCDAVLGASDSAERLRGLADALVVRPPPVGPEPGYCAHGLVREYFARRLADRGRATEAESHRAAGRWFAGCADVDRAVGHLLDSGDIGEARAVLESHVAPLLDAGSAARVRDWYRTAPEMATAPEHLHLLAAAWAEVLAGDTHAARDHLAGLASEVAQLQSAAGDEAAGTVEWLAAEALLLRSYLDAWGGRLARSLTGLRQVQTAFGDGWGRTAHQVAPVLTAQIHSWLGDDAAAAAALAPVTGRPGTIAYFRRVSLPSARAAILWAEGRVHRARWQADQALDAVAAQGRIGTIDDCSARLTRARTGFELGQIDVAERDVSTVMERADEVGHVPFGVLARTTLAAIRAAGGDRAGAGALVGQAGRLVTQAGAGRELTGRVQAAAVEVALAADDAKEARRLLHALSPGHRDPFLELRVAGTSRAMTVNDVVTWTRQHRPTTPRQVVEVRLLMASALAVSQPAHGTLHLRTAAELADEQGLHRALCGRHQELLALAEAAAAEPGGEHLRVLLDARHAPKRPAPGAAPSLSPGERVLLRHLATSTGNRALADELGVSINTVKTRLRRLYAKLGVHDRAGALAAVPPDER